MSLPCYDTAISTLAMALHFVIPRLDFNVIPALDAAMLA